MKTYLISIYGVPKKTIQAASAELAIIRASFIWANGNTQGISAKPVE